MSTTSKINLSPNSSSLTEYKIKSKFKYDCDLYFKIERATDQVFKSNNKIEKVPKYKSSKNSKSERDNSSKPKQRLEWRQIIIRSPRLHPT